MSERALILHPSEIPIFVTVVILQIVVGSLANIVVITIFFVRRELLSWPSDLLVLNLSCADLLCCVVSCQHSSMDVEHFNSEEVWQCELFLLCFCQFLHDILLCKCCHSCYFRQIHCGYIQLTISSYNDKTQNLQYYYLLVVMGFSLLY